MFLLAASPWILVRAGRQPPGTQHTSGSSSPQCTYCCFIPKKLQVSNSSMLQKGSKIISKPSSGIQTWNGCTVAFLVWFCKTGRQYKIRLALYQELRGNCGLPNVEQTSVLSENSVSRELPSASNHTLSSNPCVLHSDYKCTEDKTDASVFHSPSNISSPVFSSQNQTLHCSFTTKAGNAICTGCKSAYKNPGLIVFRQGKDSW